MAVETHLGIAGKVRRELDEEGAEVVIDAVEVVLVDHRRRFVQPRIGLAGARIFLADGADNRGSFLGFANEEDAFLTAELGEIIAGNFILALTAGKRNDVQSVVLRELLDGLKERHSHAGHDLGGGEQFAAMLAKKPSDLVFALKTRLDDVQVQAVDAFEGQGDMLLDDISNRRG